MLPSVTVFSREIPLYGVMAGAGLVLAVLYLVRAQRRWPEIRADAELAFAYGLIGAFVGAKLLSLLTVLPELVRDLPALLSSPGSFLTRYLYAGFVFYGGLYGALLALWLYGRHSRCGAGRLAGTLLPVIPLVHALGRIGCFCAGCCYGRPSALLGVAFSRSGIAPNGVPLLPVQLFEAAWELGLFFLLRQMACRACGGRQMLGWYLVLYSLARFALEFLRGDGYRGFIGPLSLSQVIAAASVLLGLGLLRQSQAARRFQ